MQIMGSNVRSEPATPTRLRGINTTPHFAILSFHTAPSTSTISKTTLSSKATVVGVSRPTRRLRLPTRSNAPLVTQPELSSSVTPMTQPRPSDLVRTIVESAIPSIKVETVSTIPTKRLLRAFKVKLTDERTLLLNLLPPPSRLLRYEKWFVQSEAAVVEWLSQGAHQSQDRGGQYADDMVAGKQLQGASSTRRRAPQPYSDTSVSVKSQLLSYLPALIEHSSTPTDTTPAFGLFEPTPGDPISSLGHAPTPAQRRSVDFQKGLLIRRIANITSPNGRFGQAALVLKQSQAPEDSQKRALENKLDFDGADGWKKTFHLLLEGILRDGEDRAVTMSYELVRTMFHKFGHLLDAVTTPRLVVCDADDDDIVLVSRLQKVQQKQEHQDLDTPESGPTIKIEPGDSSSEFEQNADEDDATTLEIRGLQDWSNCIFGDPLFATVFSHTTPEFERGFHQLHEAGKIKKDPGEPNVVKKEEDDDSSSGDPDKEGVQGDIDDIIEDPDNAPTRILLYECYHATVAIVRQFYRPDANSSEREIAARRRLVVALAKLEHVDANEPAGKRPRRPSRDDWPVKRPRGDTPVS